MNKHEKTTPFTPSGSPYPAVWIKSVWVSGIALFALILDLGSKVLVIQHLKDQSPFTVIPGFLRFIYAENPGIAFGMFTGHSGWLNYLTPLAFVILMVILYQTFAHGHIDRWMVLIFGLIIGGALGNIIDRMYHGYVVDFIDAYYGTYHWYTFNVADSALTVGEVLLIVKLLFGKEMKSNPVSEQKIESDQNGQEAKVKTN